MLMPLRRLLRVLFSGLLWTYALKIIISRTDHNGTYRTDIVCSGRIRFRDTNFHRKHKILSTTLNHSTPFDHLPLFQILTYIGIWTYKTRFLLTPKTKNSILKMESGILVLQVNSLEGNGKCHRFRLRQVKP